MTAPTIRSSLPRVWFNDENDPDGIIRALVDVIDGEIQAEYEEFNTARTVFEPLLADARFLPFIGQKLGWTPEAWMSESFKRKLITLLVPIYRQKGTAVGIENIIRLFYGVDAHVRSPRAGGWRMGHSVLGGKRVAYTAVGGETDLDLTGDGAGSGAPGAMERLDFRAGMYAPCPVRVWRNGTELTLAQFALSDGHITLVTTGDRYVATGAEPVGSMGSVVTLTFGYADVGELSVIVNGQETTGVSMVSPSKIELLTTLTRGDVVFIRKMTDVTPLVVGDAVVVSSTQDRPTRVAPEANSVRAVTVLVELGKTLSGADGRMLTEILDVMKPSNARPVVINPVWRRPGWRLARSRLGRDTGAGPR